MRHTKLFVIPHSLSLFLAFPHIYSLIFNGGACLSLAFSRHIRLRLKTHTTAYDATKMNIAISSILCDNQYEFEGESTDITITS